MNRPQPLHLTILLLVALGGALGASARYGLDVAVPDTSGFLWTTFAINVTGSFLLALLPAFAVVRGNPYLPPLLGTGVLGGFTTLSTYSEQTRALLDAGAVATAMLYAAGTLAACLCAVALADRFTTPPERAELAGEEGDL